MPDGTAAATSSMPARAAARSADAATSDVRCHPPRGGEIPAHGAVAVSGGTSTPTGSPGDPVAGPSRRARRSSSARIGTTLSTGPCVSAAKVRRPSTVGDRSRRPAGCSTEV